MRLDGRELASYVKERHARQLLTLDVAPRLAIVRQGATPATDTYLRVKQRYGNDLGIEVNEYTETPESILRRIEDLNADPAVTGINVELPFADAPELEKAALAAVTLTKDVDGLAPDSPYEMATPKAIWWLLGAYNVELKSRLIAVVGQGRLVGKPVADQFELAGHRVKRLDIETTNLSSELLQADVIVTATGQPGLITPAMVKAGVVVIDAGAPLPDMAADLVARGDISYSPNPGGVGPVTVAALYDNLLMAAASH